MISTLVWRVSRANTAEDTRSVSHRACAETGTTADALGVTRVSQLMRLTHEHRRTATVESCCGTTKGEHPRTPTNTSRRTHNPLVAGSSPARPTHEYHVTGGLCMAGGGESCCAFRSWMLSHKFRRDALELRFHTIEESMVFGRVTAEKLQSASQLVTRPRAVRSKTRCSMRSPPRATPRVATCCYPSCAVGHSHRFAHPCSQPRRRQLLRRQAGATAGHLNSPRYLILIAPERHDTHRHDLKDTVSRVEHHGNIRIVVKFPQSRGKARAYRGPLSIPRRCPLSAVKQRCSSASPGLNRVFGLLPQRLEVLLHQWPRPTDLPRLRCVGRGLDGTPGNDVEPLWNARSVLPGESGGCSTRLCCGGGSSRRPGYPTVGAAGQIRDSRGERPCSLGRPFRSKSGGHRRLPVCGVRDTGRRS